MRACVCMRLEITGYIFVYHETASKKINNDDDRNELRGRWSAGGAAVLRAWMVELMHMKICGSRSIFSDTGSWPKYILDCCTAKQARLPDSSQLEVRRWNRNRKYLCVIYGLW